LGRGLRVKGKVGKGVEGKREKGGKVGKGVEGKREGWEGGCLYFTNLPSIINIFLLIMLKI
jgi:hypothetical protein